jgi:hypothetical protein
MFLDLSPWKPMVCGLTCTLILAAAGCTRKPEQPAVEEKPEVIAVQPAETTEQDKRLRLPAARDRREFAKSMTKIKEGMPEKEALQILGKPDDIRTEADKGGITTSRTREIWRYGTNGHLTFPTLGCVYIDDDGKVQYFYGGGPEPFNPSLPPDEKLVDLLRLIDRAPRLEGYHYDPLTIIQIVNALQPLGKETALAVIDEYLRVAPSDFDCPAREGLFLVLRVLFDVPDNPGYMPRMFVGAPGPREPTDPKRIPRFPVLLLDDVPLMLVSGYSLGGAPEPVEHHVEYFRKNGRLRANPLSPTNDPLRIYDKFQESFLWVFTEDEYWLKMGRMMVMNQLLRLIDTVYHFEPDSHGDGISSDKELAPQWKAHAAAIAKLEFAWDRKTNQYRFKDGSTLPSAPKKPLRP